MDIPLVSVILAVKNGGDFLDKAISSIQAQTYADKEILLVVGTSDDGTLDIAKSFSGIRILIQKSQGVASAYNEGIAEARGAYVAFLSHDDLWAPHKLFLQASYLHNHPDIEYVVCKAKFFLEGLTPPLGFRNELLEQEPVCRIMETLMARKTLFERIGNFNPGLETGEDVDWFCRCQDASVPWHPIPEVLLYKRVHGKNLSLTAAGNNQNLLKALRNSILRKKGR